MVQNHLKLLHGCFLRLGTQMTLPDKFEDLDSWSGTAHSVNFEDPQCTLPHL